MPDTELEIGQQSDAARVVAGAVEPLTRYLTSLSDSFEQTAAGYVGNSANACARAAAAWFEAAGDLVPILEQYAQDLVEVDRTAASTEAAQQAAYARLAGRLGGGQR